MASSTPPRPIVLPSLPPEIILHIIDCLIPTAGLIPIAFPASNSITKTLLSLIFTSKLTYATALRHLYSRCLYIDSLKRLRGAFQSIRNSRFGRTLLSQTFSVPLLPQASSLYLVLPDSKPADEVKVLEFLDLLAPGLKLLHLTTDFRLFGSLSSLHKSVIRCTSLEFLLGSHEILGYYRFMQNTSSWPDWSNLRTLGVYDVSLDSEKQRIWWAGLANLETLVLTRIREIPKFAVGDHWKFAQLVSESRKHSKIKKRLNLVLVDFDTDTTPQVLWESKDKMLQIRQVIFKRYPEHGCLEEERRKFVEETCMGMH